MPSPHFGIVTIGRNEGARLIACLSSVRSYDSVVIYVDSGSSDGSVQAARSLGVEVVELDMSIPFTAARARNAGLERLRQLTPDLSYVQFVDGDCEVCPGWIDTAITALAADPRLVAVCGRIRERHAASSIYSALCELEWEKPVGDIAACGGNAMMRIDALVAVGGFNPALIAGEEPDLCQRLRLAGGGIQMLPHDMVLHDIDIHRFSQWWRRSVRWGHAAAELAHLHAHERGPITWKPTLRAAAWGIGMPLATAFASRVTPLAGLALAAYPLQVGRLYLRQRLAGRSHRLALAHAVLNTVDKVSESIGALRYAWGTATGKRSAIIEHKQAPVTHGARPGAERAGSQLH